MRIFAAIIYFCLMAVPGCHEGRGVTTITRASTDGHDTLFSKITSREGVADFHCLASTTGHCHYLVFADDCQAGQAGHCQRRTLQRLDLEAGQTYQVKGLPEGFQLCVDGKVPAEGCGRG
ncbi:MAG TPA: hypothetical protein VM687_04195 [Stenotrophomonas sp.]|nr:hypothetical protein [Stenotrophomonas sp.]